LNAFDRLGKVITLVVAGDDNAHCGRHSADFLPSLMMSFGKPDFGSGQTV
jgi:hypothetical protein